MKLNALFASFVYLLTLVFSPITLSADCHNKSQSACEKNDECTWVHGYTRSDGIKVNSYCRAKPGHGDHASKDTSSSEPSPKKHSEKTKDKKQSGKKSQSAKKETPETEKSHKKTTKKREIFREKAS